MNHSWAQDAIFYHIYPLGLCAAPRKNDFQSPPAMRLGKLYPWLDHIQRLGATAIYLGPLFESSTHGYDTADYYHVDRRLGDRRMLSELSAEIHRRGMRLVLDGVFNHVGRDFWAFRDLRERGAASAYTGWFHSLDFSRRSPYGDPFSYEGWSGHYSLVKLNLANPHVRQHLFDAVRMWVEEFQIDGLRLDAADVIAPDFLQELSGFVRGLRSDFWLTGEIVFGDYRRLASDHLLDSATNYETYKSLYSSHNDRNYFEIAYTLNRQFGPDGIYRGIDLYNFVDNHDVNRIASSLNKPAHLYPLHILLFTIPGIPSIYYGSEWGIPGRRSAHSDLELRPALDLSQLAAFPNRDLAETITRLARVRHESTVLRRGEYRELIVAAQQFAFLRSTAEEQVVTAVNASAQAAEVQLRLPYQQGWLEDRLNPGEGFAVKDGQACIPLLPSWGRILVYQEVR